MYRDYRRMQRSTFLVAHAVQREQAVRKEMERWINVMIRLGAEGEPGTEVFALDCHDLSLENIFVDDNDHSKIVRFLSRFPPVIYVANLFGVCRHASLTGNRLQHALCGHVHISRRSFYPARSPQNSFVMPYPK